MPKGDLIPSRGAISEPLLMEVVRELTPEDIARLGSAPKTAVPVLQKLRATHHRQAALMAEGKSNNEIAAIVGCTPQRLVQLQADPTFRELVGHYRDQIITGMLSDASRLKDKLVDMGEMAVDEMKARLEDDALRAKIPMGELRQVAEMAMDRTVAPPQAAPNVPPPLAQITISIGGALRNVAKELISTAEGGATPDHMTVDLNAKDITPEE